MGRPKKIVVAALSVMSLPALLTEFADCARTKVSDEYSQTEFIVWLARLALTLSCSYFFQILVLQWKDEVF